MRSTRLSFFALAALLIGTAGSVAAQNPELQMGVNNLSPEVGQLVTFTVQARRNGSNIDNVIVVDLLPAGLSYDSHSISQGSYTPGDGEWDVGRINGSSVRELQLTARVDAIGTFTNEADVTNPAGGHHAEVTVTSVAPPTLAELCYTVADAGGSNGGDDRLVRVLKSDGSSSPIGPGTGTSTIEATAYWPGPGTLYAADADRLGTIDLATGEFTEVNAGDPTFGSGDGALGAINFTDVDGLTFDPFTGNLFGSHRRGSGADDLLLQINPSTGKVVADAFGVGIDYVVIPSTSVGRADIDDIAISPIDSRLYGVANNGGNDLLLEIDRVTGAVTDLGELGVNDMEGLNFNSLGNLYGITGSGGSFYQVTISPLSSTLISALNGGSDFESIACLTEGSNTLSGIFFYDANADGVFTGGTDSPVGGGAIQLWRDANSDGVVDPAIDMLLATQNTAADGSYAFMLAAEGDFLTRVDPATIPANFVPTTDDLHPCSFIGFGNDEPNLDFGFSDVIDLALSMSVDNGAPAVGENVTFTVTLSNQAASDASGIQVSNHLIAIADTLDIVSVAPSQGAFANNIWDVGSLAAGASVTLTITVRSLIDAIAFVNLAEVAAANGTDIDSTPYNDVTSEDDYASESFSTGGSSSGGEAGLESNGSLAQALAHVQFDRRQTHLALTEAGVRLEPAPLRNTASNHSKGASVSLNSIVPSTGPSNSTPYQVSPHDLLPVTNAISVLAADYVREADGRRVGVFFGTTTEPGEIYEHTKVVCDRLRGATLEGIELVDIHGHPFVVSRLRYPDGSYDYAASLVAYPDAGGFTIDSRYLLREYVPQGSSEILNLQVWGVSKAYAAELVAGVLDNLAANGPLQFENTYEAPPTLPQVFIRSGEYNRGRLYLEVYNAGQASALNLSGGTLSRTESGEPTSFAQTVGLPSSEDTIVQVEVETGPLFDVAFFAENSETGEADLLYIADGSWGYTADQSGAEVDVFSIDPEPVGPLATGTRPVERPVRLAGDVTTWAGIFRYLRPGGAPVDLSEYSYVEFDAWGYGAAKLLVEKASINTSDHFAAAIELAPEPSTHRVWFEDLRLDDGSRGFTGEDAVVLSFYIYGDGVTSQPFALNLANMKFGGAEGDEAELPGDYALATNYPNPFNSSTTIRYELPQAEHVRLAVYDLLGRRVAVLADGQIEAGRHETTLNGSQLASGVYVYRLEAGNRVLTSRMSVIH